MNALSRIGNYSNPLAALLAALALASPAPAAQSVDRVVAVVNGEAILQSTIDEEIEQLHGFLRGSGQRLPNASRSYKLAMDNLIRRRLQLQRANQLGIAPTRGQVDNAIKALLDDNEITLAQLLRSQNLAEGQLRRIIAEDLAIDQALFLDNQAALSVTQLEVNEILRAYGRDTSISEYLVEHARLPASRAAEARRLRSLPGDEFAAAAAKHAVGDHSVEMGWQIEFDLPDDFVEALSEIKPGQYTRVIVQDDGLHVLRLVAERPMAAGQIREGKVTLQTLQAPATASMAQLADLKGGILAGDLDFEAAAQEVGGAVEIAEHEVAELSKAVAQGLRYRVGEVAGPFATDAGPVVVQVLDVKMQLFGSGELRDQAHSQLSESRLAVVRGEWLENLEAAAGIEILHAEP